MSTARAPMPGYAKLAHALLLAGFAGQVLVGHLVAFGLGGPLFRWHQDRVGQALWGASAYAHDAAAYRGWIQALLGGTMIAYAWAMLFVVAVPLRRGERWAAWAIGVATLNWFVVDTSVSAAHHVWVNVALNIGVLITIAVPLAMLVSWLRRANLH